MSFTAINLSEMRLLILDDLSDVRKIPPPGQSLARAAVCNTHILNPAPLRSLEDGSPCDETELLQTWYRLVLEKNRLGNYESELMIFAQELELEDTQSQLQQKLWRSMAVEDSRKSPQELSEEQQMFAEMMRVVEKRDALVVLLEERRISESTDGRDLESIVHQFHWT